MEKKDNNEDEGRVKRKDEYPPTKTKGETGAGDGKTRGRRRMKRGRGGEEKEAEAEAGNLDRIDHLLKPRVLVAADRPSTPFAKIWILLDLRVELKVR